MGKKIAKRNGAIFSIIIICALVINTININSVYAHNKQPLEKAGDILQIVNPIVAGSISTQEKGLGHFAIIYGQAIGIMGVTKLIGNSSQWDISKRPATHFANKTRFDGFPSGHTTSAWTAASYIRVFSEDYKLAAVPLYMSAALTGYSRVKAKAHTTTQVLMAVVLSEAVTMINYKLEWSNSYRTTSINFAPDGVFASLKINL